MPETRRHMQQPIIRFGPAGNSQSFYDQGFKHTWQAPAWIAEQGLNAFEYSGGHGINMKEESARKIGGEAAAHGIALSIHAPYYINLANATPEGFEKNLHYLMSSARAVDWMGGDRVILHMGSPKGMEYAEAMQNVREGLLEIRKRLVDDGLAHVRLCPETMGRDGQLGSLEDVLSVCEMEEGFLPNIDFAHLHARGRGALNEEEDFDAILRRMLEVLGRERVQCFHSHFCHIEYTTAGEKRHHTFADTQFGPDFRLLAPCLLRHGLTPRIICESSGTQAEDAREMRDIYVSLQEKQV